MKMNHFTLLISIASMITLLQSAKAEDICVSNSTEFQAALDTAENNGQDDHIKLKRGNYPILDDGSFYYSFFYNPAESETFALKISGGWRDFNGGQCNFITLNSSALETTIDGLNEDQALVIWPDGNSVEIEALTFTNGKARPSSRGGGLSISGTHNTGTVLIQNNAFFTNEADYGSALNISAGYKIIVRNNLIIANNSYLGLTVSLLSGGGGKYFTNNTVIANTTGGSGPLESAVRVFASSDSPAFIANNIMWNNEVRDLIVDYDTHLHNNDIGTYTGIAIEDINNFSEEPEFQISGPGDLSFTPAYNSNLYNKGTEPPIFTPIPIPFESDWDLGVNDIFGFDRKVNGQVDIGAFETQPEPPIFKNGFE